jgi:hypothetical protein
LACKRLDVASGRNQCLSNHAGVFGVIGDHPVTEHQAVAVWFAQQS